MFTLTQKVPIPTADNWESVSAHFPLEEIYMRYTHDLRALQNKFQLRKELCPDNFRGNKFSTELLSKIVEYSQTTVRKLISEVGEDSHVSVGDFSLNKHVFTPSEKPLHSASYYTYLELYRKVFSTSFTNRIRTRYEEIKNKAVGRRKIHLEEVGVKIKGVPLRSFHILDDSADSTKSFRIIINQIESETGSSIAWNHLSTYSHTRDNYDRIEHIKDSAHWTKGVDGDGCTIANIRAWKNKITTVLKNVDVCIINNVGTDCTDTAQDLPFVLENSEQECDLTAGAIGFVLMNLNPSGTAIISLQISSLVNASTISLIHLFSLCFDEVRIIHTEAEDRIFLCGVEFKGNIISRQYPEIINACLSRRSIFSTAYMNGDEFTSTVEKLLNIIRAATEWRLAQYKKMFDIYEKMSKSFSGRVINGHIERMLEEYYPIND